MAKFILTTIGTSGDVVPFLQIGEGLQQHGHEVLLLSNSAYQQRAEQPLDPRPQDGEEHAAGAKRLGRRRRCTT